MSRLPTLSAIAASLILSGCGAGGIEYLYDQAPMFLMGEIDSRLCPSKERRPTYERHIAIIHKWHRAKELPRYAKLLRKMASSMEGGVTRAEFDAVVGEIEQTVKRTVAFVGRRTVTTLAEVEPREVKCLTRQAEESHEKAMAELDEAGSDYATERIDKMLSMLERFTDDFSKAQKSELAAKWKLSVDDARAAAKLQHKGALAFIAILQRDSVKARAAGLTKALARPDGLYTKAEAKIRKAARDQAVERLWDVLQIMTVEQRAGAAKQAVQFAEILERMSR